MSILAPTPSPLLKSPWKPALISRSLQKLFGLKYWAEAENAGTRIARRISGILISDMDLQS